jgi:hypothetical protein
VPIPELPISKLLQGLVNRSVHRAAYRAYKFVRLDVLDDCCPSSQCDVVELTVVQQSTKCAADVPDMPRSFTSTGRGGRCL